MRGDRIRFVLLRDSRTIEHDETPASRFDAWLVRVHVMSLALAIVCTALVVVGLVGALVASLGFILLPVAIGAGVVAAVTYLVGRLRFGRPGAREWPGGSGQTPDAGA